jgi:tyrosine-specific transport protein
MVNNTFLASSILIGTIIGAGFLGLPYVIMLSGFSLGIINLMFVAFLVCLTMIYLGEVTLRTSSLHQLPGYAQKYLGSIGKNIMLLSVMFGVYAGLLAYIIAQGESLSQIITKSLSYSFEMSILFWIFLSLLGYFGIKTFKKGEQIGVGALFLMVLLTSLLFFDKINMQNLLTLNLNYAILPFGVALFAFLGFVAVPEVRRIIGHDKKNMKKSIILSYIFITLVYLAFLILVLGSQGENTPQLATIALGTPFIILGIITMFNAYLANSNALIDTFHLDLKQSKIKSWAYTIIIPLIMFSILTIIDRVEFTTILNIGGILSGGVTAILIILIAKKSKLHGDRHPEYSVPLPNWLAYLIISIFSLGIILGISSSIA